MARRGVLVLGATGMLGNAVLRYFASRGEHTAAGTIRSQAGTGRQQFSWARCARETWGFLRANVPSVQA
jgi:dTDP-4-dehydrorhamnose reductase